MAITEALHFHSNAMVPVAYLKGEGSQQPPPQKKKSEYFFKSEENFKRGRLLTYCIARTVVKLSRALGLVYISGEEGC